MRKALFDNYAHLDTAMHHLPAALKLIVALSSVVVLVVVRLSAPVLFAIAVVVLLAGALVGRIPLWFLVRRVILLEPFVLGVSILVLMEEGGGGRFLLLVGRGTACLTVLVLLANTTAFSDLLDVLKRWHVPGLMITTLALMYRHLFVLREELSRLRHARASRSFEQRSSRGWTMGSGMIAQLFVRAANRSVRIYAAMCARGWE